MKKIIKFFKKWDQIWVILIAVLGLCFVSGAILTTINYLIKLIN